MPEFEVRPYDSALISPEDANWKVNGEEGDWNHLKTLNMEA